MPALEWETHEDGEDEPQVAPVAINLGSKDQYVDRVATAQDHLHNLHVRALALGHLTDDKTVAAEFAAFLCTPVAPRIQLS